MILWLAQGFGLGRIPFTPGTFGSLAGMLWFGVLLSSGSLWIFTAGLVLGLFFSVWLCGAAEKILRQKDPSSVIFDELTAIPLCFMAWVALLFTHNGKLPAFEQFFTARTWPLTLGVFLLFRLLDIAKPWPVRQSQALPGGWGITVDDALAAVYVNVVWLVAYAAGLRVE